MASSALFFTWLKYLSRQLSWWLLTLSSELCHRPRIDQAQIIKVKLDRTTQYAKLGLCRAGAATKTLWRYLTTLENLRYYDYIKLLFKSKGKGGLWFLTLSLRWQLQFRKGRSFRWSPTYWKTSCLSFSWLGSFLQFRSWPWTSFWWKSAKKEERSESKSCRKTIIGKIECLKL